MRDRDVVLQPGELFVVPRGVEHCPEAAEETLVLRIEFRDTVNTGDAGGELTPRRSGSEASGAAAAHGDAHAGA